MQKTQRNCASCDMWVGNEDRHGKRHCKHRGISTYDIDHCAGYVVDMGYAQKILDQINSDMEFISDNIDFHYKLARRADGAFIIAKKNREEMVFNV